jgi:tetratricopeptide (TPR) repeat protein
MPNLPEPAARLLRLLALHPGPEFGLLAAAALADLPIGRTRALLDDLTDARRLEQAGPDRYRLTEPPRAEAAAGCDDEPTALRRLLDWYLRTADAAQSWITPGETHLPLPGSSTAVAPMTFADYDAAVDWAEREQRVLPRLVRAAASAGLDRHTWLLAALTRCAQPPSTPAAEWLDVGPAGLEAATGLGDREAQLWLLLRLGMSYRAVNRLAESLDSLNQARALARASGNPLAEARALNLVGLLHLRTRRLDLAAEHFEQAVRAFRQLGEPRFAAMALSNVASSRLAAGRLQETAAAAQEALAAHRAQGNRASEGNILRVAAALHLDQGDCETALRTAQQAVDIALALRDHVLEGFVLITLGDAQRAAGRLPDALTSYHRSASLHRRLSDRSREALAWRGVGERYVLMGRHAEAVHFHRRANAVHRELGDTWQHALELECLGIALHPQDPEAADAHWTHALHHLADYDDPRAVGVRERIERHIDDPGGTGRTRSTKQ